MALSSSTLIHFTDNKEKLKSILEESFRIYYCRERVDFDSDASKVNDSGYIAPMVSFCDIPLSEVKSHITKYGSYGIGLTKEWGVKNGLNPVLYINDGSSLSKSYRTAYNNITNNGKSPINTWTGEQKAVIDVLRYIKNYEADLTRKSTTISNYRFSDEREWRYVPPHTEDCWMIMHVDNYDDENLMRTADEKLKDLRLTFTPNDIKYIIIPDESEIGEFIDHLRRTKGNEYSLHDIERLTTRILTSTQIQEDI